jgi:hypothetical protein
MWLSQWREEKAGRIERSGRIEIEKPTRLTGHLDATPSSHRRRRSWATWPKPAFQGVALSSHDHRCRYIYIYIYIMVLSENMYTSLAFFYRKSERVAYVRTCMQSRGNLWTSGSGGTWGHSRGRTSKAGPYRGISPIHPWFPGDRVVSAQ